MSYLTEVITNRLIYTNHTLSSITIAKFYMLFEYIILIALEKNISKPNSYIKTITIVVVAIR